MCPRFRTQDTFLRFQYLCVVSSRYCITETFCMLHGRLADATVYLALYSFKLKRHLDCLCVIISNYKCCTSNEPIFAYYTRQYSSTCLEGNCTYLRTCQTGTMTGIAFAILHIVGGSAENHDFQILYCPMCLVKEFRIEEENYFNNTCKI